MQFKFSSLGACLRRLTCALHALAALCGTAFANEFPTKPITFVVPAPPGGPTDILARMFAEDLRQAWNQPVLIDNRPGAGGLIATQFVKKAPGDGYTLLLAFTSHLTNPALNSKAGYDPITDFTPISLIANGGAVLAFNPALPIRSWPDFLRYARERGGVNIGHAGAGTSTHIYTGMIADAIGIPINAIPYKGEAPLQTELVGGNLEFGLLSIGPYVRLAQAGKLQAVASTIHSPLLPGLPAFADVGVPGPGKVRGWFGVLAPAGVPDAIAQKISARLQQHVQRPEVHERLIKEWAFVPIGSSPEEFARSLRSEYAAWQQAIRSQGIKLD
jgi:tripartite-type tricarboxylate transporter receptor subunit TctC